MVRAGTGASAPFLRPSIHPAAPLAGMAGYVDPELAAAVANIVPARWVEPL